MKFLNIFVAVFLTFMLVAGVGSFSNNAFAASTESVISGCDKDNLKVQDRILKLTNYQKNYNSFISKIVQKSLQRTRKGLDLRADSKVISSVQEATTKIQQDVTKVDSDINSLILQKQKTKSLKCLTPERKTSKEEEKVLIANLLQSEKFAFEFRKASFWPEIRNLSQETVKILAENEKKNPQSSVNTNSNQSASKDNKSSLTSNAPIN